MNVRETRLDNNLIVLSDHMPGVETTSLGVWVDAGARHEAESEHGLAHLLEHMAFKGTGRRTARGIAEEIEAVGGDLNAATGAEHTAYFARILKENLDIGVDIIADILKDPRFDEDELELERDVIVQEIGTARDTPDDRVFDLFQETAFPDQPLGRSILGTEASLDALDASALTRFRAAHYGTSRMILSAAGAVDHDELVALGQHHLTDIQQANGTIAAAARYAGGELREERTFEQVHLVLGFEGVAINDDRVYAAQVLSGLLGGGMSSRLFQEVREIRGLAYAINAFAWSYADTGLFGVYAGTGPGDLDELVSVVAGELEAVATRVDQDEVARARAQLKAGLLMSLESSSLRAEQIARQRAVFGHVLDIDDIIARVENVDAEAVTRLARELITQSALTLAAVGPLEHLESYDRMAARFG